MGDRNNKNIGNIYQSINDKNIGNYNINNQNISFKRIDKN